MHYELFLHHIREPLPAGRLALAHQIFDRMGGLLLTPVVLFLWSLFFAVLDLHCINRDRSSRVVLI